MKTWNQCIKGTAVHATATATTWTKVDTITITNKASHVWGIYALIVNTKPTADEASSPLIKITCKQLNVTDLKLNAGLLGAEGMAAHSPNYVEKTFFPWAPVGDIPYAKVDIYVSSVVACTEGWDCAFQLVTSDSAMPEDLKHAYIGGYCLAFADGDIAIEAAGAGNSATLAAGGTGDADSIVVDGGQQELVGICYTVTLNAETEVPLCNYAELTCADIDNFGIQQHIVNDGAPGSLGTQIDATGEYGLKYIPFIFDGLPAVATNITIEDINSLTGLTAGDGILGIVWK